MHTDINTICKIDGTIINNNEDIANEVLDLYGNLMGNANDSLVDIDIMDMREGPQLNCDQRRMMISHVTESEIIKALMDIGDLKAPGINGFGAKFYKASLNTVKYDLVVTSLDFFDNERMYVAFNTTLVTPIPKTNAVKTIKDYRPISCCTTFYKIISRVLTCRMSDVMNSIINQSQVAFVPG